MSLEIPPRADWSALIDSGQSGRVFDLLEHPVVSDCVEHQRPWGKVRPIARDAGLDPLLCWAAVKLRRRNLARVLSLRMADGSPFTWPRLGLIEEQLHRIDLTVGGGVEALEASDGVLNDPETKTRIKLRSLMDEAAESSIMEGAATTRDKARELLRSDGTPSTKAERMVVNNYLAMQMIKERLGEPLTPQWLLELQSRLTEGTWDPGEDSKQGRFRASTDPVEIVDRRTLDVIFTPPPADALRGRLDALCAFANGRQTGSSYIHPLLKACVLHFMIGYEHPFCDGNGRTARAIFYWQALRSGYGVFEFLSISEVIAKAWGRYAKAYVHTETDEGDLGYFLDFHVDVIRQSLDRLQEHLAREAEQIKTALRLVTKHSGLNLRQRLLIEHAIRHPKAIYTVKAHAGSYGITLNTARADLEGLVRSRLLIRSGNARSRVYLVSAAGIARLQRRQQTP